MKASNKSRFFIILAVVILAIAAIILVYELTAPKEINFSGSGDSLESWLFNGKTSGGSDVTITGLYVDGAYSVKIRLKGVRGYSYFANIPNRATLPDILNEWAEYARNNGRADIADYIKTIPVSYNDPSSGSVLSSILVPILLYAVLAIVFIIILRKSMGANSQAMNFGKTTANQVRDIKVRFNDVAGAEEEKQELQEIVDFLKYPKKYTDIGARIPRGVLLVGPPGTGKTLFAKAVAGEANVPFFSISGSDFVEMFVGVGASRVRDLFDQAKKNMPCIIFIDEIDAVGRQRGAGLGGGNDEREQTLNQLLVQMDGFEASSSIIVMAATNRADILDPALMRPGRFDRQIYVNVPDVKGREEIFKVHSRNKPLSAEINFKSLARLTAGFTGADIENILNESAILAARENRKLIEMKDISEAINKVMAGPAKRSRLVTETDKRITAYHESGHAIVAKLMKHCDSVHEVSIIPRGMAAGYTITLPENDDNHMTKGKLLDNIAMMLAGRAAEEIVIQDISTGASNDIQRASKIARKMVTEWGMSDTLGNMYLGASEEVFLGRDYQTQLNYSDEVAAKIDAEVKRILDEQYRVALGILKENRAIMDAMVKALYEKETIYEDEIDALFGEDSSDKESLFSSKINRADGEAIKPAEKAVDKATAKAAIKEDVKLAVTAETDKSDNINEETNENNAPEVTDGE
ncbi:MAG: ATP-dependent zinc metalloprotease FtsH [Clostridia bacterium]|jgi:cell division protease FtsH|nr:ATP-dependent zinc metalloprotease FtsH [Clostridia bacterium]